MHNGARTKDDHNTPSDLLEIVREFSEDGAIDLDPCSNPWSIVDAGTTFDLRDGMDGLSLEWMETHGTVFVNPPFSNAKPWAEACAHEHRRNPLQDILLLTKCDTSVWWWIDGYRASTAACAFKKRFAFIRGEKRRDPSPFALSMMYFGPRPNRFAEVFSPHGIVWARPVISIAMHGLSVGAGDGAAL